jgi:hypothetical protein
MIQFKRGKTSSWSSQTAPLADGQPGYDKDKHKLKIGDGKSSWNDLPSVSGLRMDEILVSEEDAKKRLLGLLSPLELLRKTLSIGDKPIITYGKEAPNNDTTGQIYLQYYDGAVEADYVIETGKSVNYFYRKWNSGFIECWGKGTVPTSINNKFTTIIFNVKTGDYYELKGFWK